MEQVFDAAMMLVFALYLCAVSCKAQDFFGLSQIAASRSLPPFPPSSGNDISISSLEPKCPPGDFIPGPTCDSFYMCVGNIYAARKVKFVCGPGTVFSDELNVCVHGVGSKCLAGLPSSTTTPSSVQPPAEVSPLVPTSPPVPTPGPSPPPKPTTEPTSSAPPTAPAPPPTTTISPGAPSPCNNYDLDPDSVYECVEPGYFPSYSDCTRFYKCIATMSCTVKGFMFRCPKGYLYDTSLRRCNKEENVGICDRVSDAAGQKYQVTSVVELTPEVLEQFFEAQHYWQVMPFLPEEPQRIVAVSPATFSRGSYGDYFMNGF